MVRFQQYRIQERRDYKLAYNKAKHDILNEQRQEDILNRPAWPQELKVTDNIKNDKYF